MTLGQAFESLGSAVRWPGVLLGHLTVLVWVLIWKRLRTQTGEDSRLKWWVWLVLCSPLLGFGSLVLTPDLPVLFFWSTSILFAIYCLQGRSLINYLWLGISLGLGFCAKYHIVLFVPLLLIYLTVDKKWKDVSFRGVLLTLAAGLMFCSPVLIWNFQNDFISFRFQLAHGLSRPEYEAYWTWTYVLAQFLVLFPTVVWAALRARPQGLERMFLFFGWGPLVFFFLSSFKALVEVNWPIIAYPAFYALAVLSPVRPVFFKIANAFWVLLFVLLTSHLFRPWIPSAPGKLAEFSEFRTVSEARSRYEPLYASTYQMASWVWFDTKTPFFKLRGMSRYDIFDTFPEGDPQKVPFYVALRKGTDMPPWITQDPEWKVQEVETLGEDFVVVKVDR